MKRKPIENHAEHRCVDEITISIEGMAEKIRQAWLDQGLRCDDIKAAMGGKLCEAEAALTKVLEFINF